MNLIFILFISYQLVFINLIVTGFNNDSLKADKFFQLGDSLYFESQFDNSNHYFEIAAELFKKSKNWERYLECYKNIGFNFSILRENDLAEIHLNNALEVVLPFIGDSSIGISGIYNSLGVIYYHKNDFKKSLEYFDKTMRLKTKIFAKNDPSLAYVYDNKGLVYQAIGDFNKAKENSIKALSILQQSLPPDHIDLAILYNNSGEIYQLMGDNITALEFHNKALKIRIKNLGTDHLMVGGSYLNIGNIYEENEEYDMALVYYEKSLAIWKNIFEPNHPYIALCYANIGLIMNSLKNFNKALEFYNSTLIIQLNSPENDDLNTANTYINIGNTYHDMAIRVKRKENTFKLSDSLLNLSLINFTKCLKIREKIFGNENLKVAETLGNIGDIYSQKLEFEKAETFYDSTIKIFQNYYESRDRNFAIVRLQKAQNHILNGYLNSGLNLLQEAITGMVYKNTNHQIFSNANLNFKNSDEINDSTKRLHYPLLLKILVSKADALETKWDKEN